VSATRFKTVTAPAAPGPYWVGACVDAVGGELTTNNQCSLEGVGMTIVGRPNLRTLTPGVTQSVLLTRGSLGVTVTVENLGDAASPATTLRYYASADATITTADAQIGTATVAALAVGAATAYSQTVQAPTTPGTYWIGGCVDVVANETVTANQCSTGVPITLTHFTDDALTAGMMVKAIHFQEMRAKVNALRTARSMAAAVWTDPALAAGTMIKAIHLQEIRTALSQVYAHDGAMAPGYTNISIASGTSIRVIDIIETRAAIVARP
jgi:hypothetical protein